MTTAQPSVADIELSSDDVRVLTDIDGGGEVHIAFLSEPSDLVVALIEAWPVAPVDLEAMSVQADYLVLHLKSLGAAGTVVRWLWGDPSPLDEIVAKARSIAAARTQALADVTDALNELSDGGTR